MQYICKKHFNLGIQYSTAYNLSLDVNNCYACNCEHIRDRQVFDIDMVRNIIEKNGKNKLLSNYYTNANARDLSITCALYLLYNLLYTYVSVPLELNCTF